MRKTVKFILIGLAAAIVLILAAVPFVVPRVVKRLAEAKSAEFGFPTGAQMSLGYTWNGGPELAGTLQLGLLESPLRVCADFGLGLGTWHAHVQVPQTEFSESDPTVARLLERYPLPDVSNLVFSASVGAEAFAERTHRKPVPVWSAQMKVRDVSVSLVRDARPISVAGLSTRLCASGIADHLDIAPTPLHVSSLEASGFTLTNITAAIHVVESSLLVTEAKADLCGGELSLYALRLNTKTLSTGFSLFMSNIDAGEILGHFKGFHGVATGRLNGKLRLYLHDGGNSIRIRDANLSSSVGETGKIKMADAGVVTDNLALAGIDEATRQNVSNALTDLDYSVLKIDLKRTTNDSATLGIRLDGSATRDKRTVPVNLNLNFNGNFEQLVNTGLGFSKHLKGKKK